MIDVRRGIFRGMLAILLAGWFTTSASAQENRLQLESVVILSRHGVRSPTKFTSLMEDVTPDEWPQWPVADGELTPRGERLMSLMGEYYRQLFQKQALLPMAGCPADGAAYAWTDIAQRTRKTGEAFLEGLAPGCGLTIHHQQDVSLVNPLFHPAKAGICTLDPDQVTQAIEQKAAVPLDQLDQHYADNLDQMGRVLDFPRSPYCQQQVGAGRSCVIEDAFPTTLKVKRHGEEISLSGALGLSSTLAEIFLLEQAQGMPEVAWGRIQSPEQWTSLLTLHNVQFELLERTPYIARRLGTPLLQTIAQALMPGSSGKPSGPLTLPSSLLFLGGHDTNIANVAGMLGLKWELPGQPDNTPPGGALVFERWRNPTDDGHFIHVSIIYQTLQQLRDQTPLSLAQPPGQVTLELPACQGQDAQGMCPLPSFLQLVSRQIEPACEWTPP